MAHFYTSASNSRGKTTTAAAGKNQGQDVHVRTWTHGVRVSAEFDETTGTEIFKIYVTSGSNGGLRDRLAGAVIMRACEPSFVEVVE